jgi:hypothetical protein
MDDRSPLVSKHQCRKWIKAVEGRFGVKAVLHNPSYHLRNLVRRSQLTAVEQRTSRHSHNVPSPDQCRALPRRFRFSVREESPARRP